MIQIKKNEEPKAWVEYRNTPGVDYQSIPELVESLLKEQGYICAYCMRRIPHKDKLSKKDDDNCVYTSEDHRIEHILSRSKHDDQKLNYNNMVICCPGHIGTEKHCDRLKGENDISFSPLDPHFIETLSYHTDGKIVSSDEQFDKEINEILNLNTSLLKANRKASWDAVITNIKSPKGDKSWNKATLSKLIEKYNTMHKMNGRLQYIPYCGIVSFYLKKKLRNLP